MSPTTLRPGARALGALLLSAALVGAPAAAHADTPTPTGTPTVDASPSPSATTPAPTATPEPSASPEPSATATPSPSASAPSSSPSPTAATPSAPALAAALPGPSEPQTAAAAAFVARTLAERDDHYTYPGGDFFDAGNTIDGVLALAAAGGHAGQVGASLDYLAANLGSYTGADFGDTYVGGTAKALIGVVAGGRDPRAFGGTDLVTTLRGLETSSGRFSDTGSGDYTITITQALAIVGLARAGQPVTSPSIEVLLDQQCADGGFRGEIGGATCVSDPDATAFAVQALLAVDDTLVCWNDVEATRTAAAAGATRGLDHLADAQLPSGGLASTDGTPNANTTGVALQAFTAGGRSTEAGAAASFVAGLQYDDTAPVALRGGIAFSTSTRSTSTPSDTDLRATPQAALGLSGRSLLDVAAEGTEPPARAEVCPVQPSASPSATPTVTASTSTEPTAGAAGPTTAAPVAAAPAGALAQTGADPLVPVLVGLALLVLGGVAVVASRRRGAHA